MIGWIDCSAGVSGDMLLAALADAGAPVPVMQAAVDATCPEPVRLRTESVIRGGLRATRVHVEAPPSTTHRTWADVRSLLEQARLAPEVRGLAVAAFARLADAEGTVHGTSPEAVHFHEVGALDAIADVVGVAAGLAALGLDTLHASPVAVGSGTVQTQHGLLPVPAPAVAELLRDVPTYGGGAGVELATPTGAALLCTAVAAFGDQPPMRVRRQAFGAGGRDLTDRPNVVRLLIGEPAGAATTTVVLEANVDDLDPRLWPVVLTRLLDAGASDAWLVPILMKKGRPGHLLCVLAETDVADRLRTIMFTETTTIGVRETPVVKRALSRDEHRVSVDGEQVRVKTATLDGVVVNAQPEYEDVAAVAAATGRPVKQVMAAALAAVQDAGLLP
ncbi:MAG TPA: nickel pincer cofactor biosynthesis protein LarC [Jiangellaceae bacterium]|nr:nickel pincer cofactor biosynthesis protein LarC [Jiangellaceae bacterium]